MNVNVPNEDMFSVPAPKSAQRRRRGEKLCLTNAAQPVREHRPLGARPGRSHAHPVSRTRDGACTGVSREEGDRGGACATRELVVGKRSPRRAEGPLTHVPWDRRQSRRGGLWVSRVLTSRRGFEDADVIYSRTLFPSVFLEA